MKNANSEKKGHGHRCGACHKISDAKVRIDRGERKYSESNMNVLENLCTFVSDLVNGYI